ncbi:MAG: tRNA pseudouridine synthase A, partial [Sarcina sp.]
MRNFKIEVQYDGSRYKGWQVQKGNTATIQGKLQDVLSKMENEPVQVIGCGRTDAGVHAENYVANFNSNTGKSPESVFEYLKEYLPDDISVKTVREASDRFHARYNVVSKTYVYRIDNSEYRNVFERKYVTYIREYLDLRAMDRAAQLLVGT